MNDQKTIAIEVGGVSVSAIRLKEPIGQFTHWYVDEKTQEPRYLIVNEMQQVPQIADLNDALTTAMASGRFMVAIFVVTGDVETGDQKLTMHRITHEFPYDAFEQCKTELAKNLDSEFKPPQPLQLATIARSDPIELMKQIDHEISHATDEPPVANTDVVLQNRMAEMNDAAGG